MEETIVDPVTNYVFGAFCLILLGLLVQGVRMWRTDNKEGSKTIAESAKSCSEALTKNAVANTKLSTSLDRMTQTSQRLHEELCRRPCLVEEEEK